MASSPSLISLFLLILCSISSSLLFDGGFGALLLGIAAWGLSVFLKVILGILVHTVIVRIRKASVASTIWGLWSAFCELFLAAFFLWKFEIWSPYEVVQFGLGAGVAELLITLVSIFSPAGKKNRVEAEKLEGDEKEEKGGGEEQPGNYWHTVYERFFALVGHIGSRFLIWLGIVQIEVLPVVLAIITFTAVDGLASYLKEISYDFENPKKLYKFLHFNAVISVLEIALCFLFFYY